MLRLDKLDGNRARLSFPKVRWSRRGTRPPTSSPSTPTRRASASRTRRKTKKRDYIAELEELLADGVWRTPKEAAKPKNDGGIGANVEKVKALREEPRPLRLLQRKADRAKRTRNRLATDSGV
jgi:hypothetical protein